MADSDAAPDGDVPQLRRVLATTDLSPLGDRAVRWAYALCAPAGQVHLLHVIEPVSRPNPMYAHYETGKTPTHEQREAQAEAVRAHLRELVIQGAGVTTEIEVVEAHDAVRAIRAAAERIDADVICMASHGHSGITRLLLGSVAERVIGHGHRPVFVVRPEES